MRYNTIAYHDARQVLPVLLRLSETHGIHRGDILIAGGWLIGVIAVAVLLFERPHDWASSRPSRPPRRMAPAERETETVHE